MGKVKEKEAVDELLRLLGKFLKVEGGKRELTAGDIDDFVNWDLLEYNDGYGEFSEELKSIMDSLFLMQKWKGSGVYYGKELGFGLDDVKKLVERLKKLRTVLE